MTEPQRPTLTATAVDDSFFPVKPSHPIAPGETTDFGLETVSTCEANPTGAGLRYHRLKLWIGGSTLSAASRSGVDVACGVNLTRYTQWQ